MDPQADIPPVISEVARRERGFRFTPALFIGLCLLAALAARVSIDYQIPFPKCSFKLATGLPCSFCGGTRALRALTHFQFTEAFWLNPLVTLGALASFVAFSIWALVPTVKFERAMQTFKKLPLLPIILALVAANWIYEILYLPR